LSSCENLVRRKYPKTKKPINSDSLWTMTAVIAGLRYYCFEIVNASEKTNPSGQSIKRIVLLFSIQISSPTCAVYVVFITKMSDVRIFWRNSKSDVSTCFPGNIARSGSFPRARNKATYCGETRRQMSAPPPPTGHTTILYRKNERDVYGTLSTGWSVRGSTIINEKENNDTIDIKQQRKSF